MPTGVILFTVFFTFLPVMAAEPEINIVFPAAGASVTTDSRTYVIGWVTPPDTPLTVNSQTVTPWRTGGFLHMAPVTPGTNTLVIRAGATEYRHLFSVPCPSPAWDGKSLLIRHPAQPLGIQTNEPVRLECLAPTGLTVRAAVGERTISLAPQNNTPTRYAGSVTFAAPVESVPVTFFAEALADKCGASLTARTEWPAHTVTGGLFEVRARTDPGDGDTAAFLPPGLHMQGAGFIGEQTRCWLGGHLCYVGTRYLAPAPASARPPRDQPYPDLASGFGPHPPTNRTPSQILIVLDPGHGGPSTGAVGPTGVTEKEVNLQQAKRVKSALEMAGFRVLMTRETDIDLGLYERVRLAYREKAAAFISVHHNATAPATDPRSVRHVSTYAWNDIGLRLARALHPRIAAATPIADRGVMTASFAVCRNPAVPSCLLELDFINCPEGEESLRQTDQQSRVADAILAGLRDWLAAPAPLSVSSSP